MSEVNSSQPAQQPLDVGSVLMEVLFELRRVKGKADELWALQEVADYLRYPKTTTQQRIICQPDFPSPTKIRTGKDPESGGKRWLAREVRAWALKCR